jgi:hypothetical protein
MTIFYIEQNLIGSKLVRALSFICAMNFYAFISEDAGGWLWFLGNLVLTKLSLVFTVPGSLSLYQADICVYNLLKEISLQNGKHTSKSRCNSSCKRSLLSSCWL